MMRTKDKKEKKTKECSEKTKGKNYITECLNDSKWISMNLIYMKTKQNRGKKNRGYSYIRNRSKMPPHINKPHTMG